MKKSHLIVLLAVILGLYFYYSQKNDAGMTRRNAIFAFAQLASKEGWDSSKDPDFFKAYLNADTSFVEKSGDYFVGHAKLQHPTKPFCKDIRFEWKEKSGRRNFEEIRLISQRDC